LTSCGGGGNSTSAPIDNVANALPAVAAVLREIPADSKAQNGIVEDYSYAATAGSYPYKVYIPADYRKGTPWPLYVNLHGCGTTAEQHVKSTLLNAVADDGHFIVVYPDTMPSGICWRAFLGDETSKHRGLGSDADIIAALTKEVMTQYTIDPERVYLMGMSSGAFQASVMGATYPDLYAAVGGNEGGAYGTDIKCAAETDDVVPVYAALAKQEMGARARFMPFFSLGGDLDPLGDTPAPGGCNRMAFKQWMLTNNLIAGGATTQFNLDPSSTIQGQQPNGYAWTKEVFRDKSGCEIGEHWVVHGMKHFWSGGSDEAAYATWVDPKGPSTSQLSWQFFRRFTKSGTKLPCIETK
jgi:poly(hydroxyalkanoate) depolymerase family esterase